MLYACTVTTASACVQRIAKHLREIFKVHGDIMSLIRERQRVVASSSAHDRVTYDLSRIY